jgi:hypothetical protein
MIIETWLEADKDIPSYPEWGLNKSPYYSKDGYWTEKDNFVYFLSRDSFITRLMEPYNNPWKEVVSFSDMKMVDVLRMTLIL